jgi:hypothetical protein
MTVTNTSRKILYIKTFIQYTKNRNTITWEKFRKQRNMVTKLKKNTMKTYFLERCTGGAKNNLYNFCKLLFFFSGLGRPLLL